LFNSKSHHQGKYTPKNKHKYVGDINNIRFLSSWERMCCSYFDNNPDVMYWSSETAIVKYKCPSDNLVHDYLIDFTVKYKNGKVLLIEVKPENQVILPKAKQGKSKKSLLNEHLTFMKNKQKWLAAHKYAKENGAEFRIWTERVLKKLGMPILG
jgi:hypothetical protein